MVTVTAISRSETARIRRARGWVLLYGRRKVGKTFLLRKFIPHDRYILVRRGGGALIEGGPIGRTDDYGQVIDIVTGALDDGLTVVVDEFQRLPEEFFDVLQAHHPNGRLYLVGSSMHVTRNLTGRRSPLLGLLSEVRLSLIGPADIFLGLSRSLPAESALALAPYLRDPWALRFLDRDPVTAIREALEYSQSAIPALIGEVFVEEDRFLSEVYESVIRSISSGKTSLKEVADQLFSRKLVDTNSPSHVRPYVKIMEDMDLVERVPYYLARGNRYTIRSKLMELYYYMDEKYGAEAMRPDLMDEVVRERLPFHVQAFAGELMAELLGGTMQYHADSEGDIDIIITRRGRAIFAGEVKWSKRVRAGDIDRFLARTGMMNCRKALISRYWVETGAVEVLTPDRLLAMARSWKKGRDRSRNAAT